MLLRHTATRAFRRALTTRSVPVSPFSSAAASSASGRYSDKVTIVTGGSRGIGEGCVKEFADAGSTVVFCGLEAHAPAGKALEES